MVWRFAGSLLLTLVLGTVTSFALSPRSALAATKRPSLLALEGQIMCPTCHTTLDQSDAAIAKRIEAYIRVRIAAGDTAQQIKQKLVAQFGPAILAAPPRKGFDLIAWWLPIAGLALGAAWVTAAIWRWRGDDPTDEQSPPVTDDLDDELAALLDRELVKLDA
jgi:cytochrome c-type biogenesis protein CcmH